MHKIQNNLLIVNEGKTKTWGIALEIPNAVLWVFNTALCLIARNMHKLRSRQEMH